MLFGQRRAFSSLLLPWMIDSQAQATVIVLSDNYKIPDLGIDWLTKPSVQSNGFRGDIGRILLIGRFRPQNHEDLAAAQSGQDDRHLWY